MCHWLTRPAVQAQKPGLEPQQPHNEMDTVAVAATLGWAMGTGKIGPGISLNPPLHTHTHCN